MKTQTISTKEVNTLNAWGFNGWTGSINTYSNGLVHEWGTNFYRHSPSSPHNEWYYEWKEDDDTMSRINAIINKEGKLFRVERIPPLDRHYKYFMITAKSLESAIKLAIFHNESYIDIKEIESP
jgi:hypothetical protein